MTNNRMQELITKLNKASEAYYKFDKPIMSDQSYDALYDELESLEKETGIILAGSPTQKVQGYLLNGFNKVTHSKPMLSAAKTKDINEIKIFIGNNSYYCSAKLDGATLVLRYSNGKFTQGVTRGNGTIGEDVTEACRFINNIPMVIPYEKDLEVRGECVISWDEFDRINSTLAEKYSHPRNLASGTLRQLDLNVVKERNLSFVLFEVVTDIGNDDKIEDFVYMEKLGFETVKKCTGNSAEACRNYLTELIENREYPYPCDGLIFEFDSRKYSKSLGKTAHHENCRMALKWADAEYETTLLDIEWNAGKTGVLFPTGIVEPVDLDGAITSRVTLNNITFIKNLELGIGDTVTLIRSNMVIPTITKNLTRSNNVEIPDHCPICGAKTQIIKQNDSEVLYCTNDNCHGKLLGKLKTFVSKQGLDIDGLSEKTLEDLINLDMVSNFEDIFNLAVHAEKLKKIPGYGKKSVDKLLAAINKSRNCDLQHFITALSIPGIGPSQSKELCKHFTSWNDFYTAATNNYDFTQIDGVGDVISRNIIGWFSSNGDINNLADYINFITTGSFSGSGQNDELSNKLLGKTFVITGTLNIFKNRLELVSKIESLGGSVAGSVSKNTDYLINNDVNSSSSKNVKAKQLNIPIITEEDFVKMIGGDRS